MFLLKRFPALVATFLSIWVRYGRDKTADFALDDQEEKQADWVMAASLLTLGGVVVGQRNHDNSPTRAIQQVKAVDRVAREAQKWRKSGSVGHLQSRPVFQTVLRIGALVASFAGELTALVYSIIAIDHLAGENEDAEPDCSPKFCFSLNARKQQSRVQLVLIVVVAVLTLASLLFGVRAILRILKDRKAERRLTRKNLELAAYTNAITAAAKDEQLRF